MILWRSCSRYDGNHGHGKIDGFELANEPGSFFGGTTANLVSQINTMHDAIRATNPQAKIICCGETSVITSFVSGGKMDTLLAAGMTKDLDVISYHGYPHVNAPVAEVFYGICGTTSYGTLQGGYIDCIRTTLTHNGISTSKPIRDTESSWGSSLSTLTDNTLQQAFAARFLLLNWSLGVSQQDWYAYDDEEFGTLWTSSGGLKPAGSAYEQVQSWMVGSSMTTPCSPSGTIWTCGLRNSSGIQTQAVWNTAGSSTYTVPSGYAHYKDLAGAINTISGSTVTIGMKPILLVP